ncbi:hypothetical protein [Photorhabdus sp. RM96S]|uniref:hypothetical protein n=1 Tax=Photorhabdus sp. RM96S TaxID=3342822 RepID=UPI0036DEB2EF
MKIKESDGELIDVFAIYWINEKSLCLGMPRNYGGLSAYDLSQVTVIDPTLNGELVYFQNNNPGIYHWALIKERLLDDLLELDETAYQRFLAILKAEGNIEQDFC